MSDVPVNLGTVTVESGPWPWADRDRWREAVLEVLREDADLEIGLRLFMDEWALSIVVDAPELCA